MAEAIDSTPASFPGHVEGLERLEACSHFPFGHEVFSFLSSGRGFLDTLVYGSAFSLQVGTILLPIESSITFPHHHPPLILYHFRCRCHILLIAHKTFPVVGFMHVL